MIEIQVRVEGNFMKYYNNITDSLDGADCPLRYENANLIFIDEEEVVFEVDVGISRIYRVNAIGDIEEVIFE